MGTRKDNINKKRKEDPKLLAEHMPTQIQLAIADKKARTGGIGCGFARTMHTKMNTPNMKPWRP